VTRIGDLVQKTGDYCTGQILGDWSIDRSDDVVCCLYCAHGDEEDGFFVLASKPSSTIC
jgi:hypothetical protein